MIMRHIAREQSLASAIHMSSLKDVVFKDILVRFRVSFLVILVLNLVLFLHLGLGMLF